MKALFFTSLLALFSVAQAADPIAAGNNAAGLKFMNEVTASEAAKGDKNVMTSPVSLYYALSMAYNGSAGDTFQKLSEFLGNGATLQKYNQVVQNYRDNAVLEEVIPKNSWEIKPPVFGIANSAWQHSGKSPSGGTFEFSKSYIDDLKNFYSAEVAVLDFKDKSTADTINKWAEKNTNGLIPQVLDADTIADLQWVLMNAVYIEAQWAEPFMPVYAQAAPEFTAVDGSKKTAAMIKTDGYFPYFDNSDVQAISVPFGGSDSLAFYIVLPKDLATFKAWNAKKAWDATTWNDVMAQLNQQANGKTELMMPKFNFEYSVSLKDKEALTIATGLQFLFEDNANFSAMSSPDSVPTKVGLIKQDTKIELDEKGVKAAAVTTIGGMESLSLPMAPENQMIVDRPFFFAIVDSKAGTLLFLGSVVDPTLSK